MHFHALRLIAQRREGRYEETPARMNERERDTHAPRLLTFTKPGQLLLVEHRLASWPLLGACSLFPGETWLLAIFGALGA